MWDILQGAGGGDTARDMCVGFCGPGWGFHRVSFLCVAIEIVAQQAEHASF